MAPPSLAECPDPIIEAQVSMAIWAAETVPEVRAVDLLEDGETLRVEYTAPGHGPERNDAAIRQLALAYASAVANAEAAVDNDALPDPIPAPETFRGVGVSAHTGEPFKWRIKREWAERFNSEAWTPREYFDAVSETIPGFDLVWLE